MVIKEKELFIDYLLVRYVSAQNNLNNTINHNIVELENKKRKARNNAYFNLNKKENTSLSYDSFSCGVWARLNSYSYHLENHLKRQSKSFLVWEI